jgi:Fe-S cluster assembly protein SufD
METENLVKFAEGKLNHSNSELTAFRQKYLDLFKSEGIYQDPEGYKFTSLKSFNQTLDESEKKENSLPQTSSEFINLTFFDGVLSESEDKIDGLSITSIENALPLVLSTLNTKNPLTNIHHALLSSGAVIEIQKNKKIERPIRILSLSTNDKLQTPTIIIKAGVNSQATILEVIEEKDSAKNLIQETYVEIESGANLEHIQIIANDNQSLAHTSTQVKVKEAANYINFTLNLSGKLNRRNLELELLGPGSNGESYNLYLTNSDEHSDINTIIHHRVADTTSNQIAKGILDGESKGIFTGRIHILPQAQRVVSGQMNKNLILSKKAQAHSQPQLEIFADDVKCSHGSTTGQLSDEEVFYFETRGIPAKKAKTLLALGFGLEIVLKIKNKIAQKETERMVMTTLKDKFQLTGTK